MDHTPQHNCEKGTTMPVPPQEASKSILTGCVTAWHGNCLVSDSKALEGSVYGPVHHYGRAPCHPGSLYQAVSLEDPTNCQTQAIQFIDCSGGYRTVSCTDAASLEPTGPWTASTPKPYDYIVNQIATWSICIDPPFALTLLTHHIRCCYCLLSILLPSHFTPTYMYILYLPQWPRTPAHRLSTGTPCIQPSYHLLVL
jgi:hypothetical protein